MARIASEDSLTASFLALGLTFGFVRRDDVVQWADRRIMEMEVPPTWLIDMSLSQNQHLYDLLSALEQVGKGADGEVLFKSVLALVGDVKPMSFDEAELLAKRLYGIAHHCIGDWSNRLLYESDHIADTFSLWREGYCWLSPAEIIAELARFITENRYDFVPESLRGLVSAQFLSLGWPTANPIGLSGKERK